MGIRGLQGARGPRNGGAALRRLLLDTTFLVDVERQRSSTDVIADDDDTAIAAITVAELLVGVELASKRHRGPRQAFVEDLVATIPVVPYDTRVAAQHATLLAAARRAGKPRGAHDLVIAATALSSGRTVVTADPQGFTDLPGVEVVAHVG